MKKRKDSFWGLHFDFHAQPTDIIKGLNEDDIREKLNSLEAILNEIKDKLSSK